MGKGGKLMKLPYLHTFTDKNGKRRHYVRISGVRHPLPDPGDGAVPSITFWEAYHSVVGERGRAAKRSLALRDGTIYIAGFADYVKIGFTRSPVAERIRDLSTGCPEDIKIHVAFGGTIRDEEALHARFREYRLRREWFQLAGKLADFINEMRAASDYVGADGQRRPRVKWQHAERLLMANSGTRGQRSSG